MSLTRRQTNTAFLMDDDSALAAAAPAFAPTDIAGLKFWGNPDVDPQQTPGGAAAVADADPVGRLPDQSGLANHADQATSTKRGTLKKATQNGKDTILYDGVDDFLQTASIAHGVGTGDFWIVVAAKVGASGSFCCFFSNGATSPALYLNVGLFTAYFSGTQAFNTSPTIGTFHIFELMRTGTTVKGFIDGVQQANTFTITSNVMNAALTLGSEDGTTGFFNSNIGQELFYAGSPTAPKRASLINYIGAYYGVTVTP